MGSGLETELLDQRCARVEAYDPGPYSALCLELLGLTNQVIFRQEEYLFNEDRRFQQVVLVELLERVDEPGTYLSGVHRVLEPGGLCLATFAIRMPQPDHVFLFNSVTAARELIAASGLEILSEHCLVATFMEHDPKHAEALAESSRHAANYVSVLRRPPTQ